MRKSPLLIVAPLLLCTTVSSQSADDPATTVCNVFVRFFELDEDLKYKTVSSSVEGARVVIKLSQGGNIFERRCEFVRKSDSKFELDLSPPKPLKECVKFVGEYKKMNDAQRRQSADQLTKCRNALANPILKRKLKRLTNMGDKSKALSFAKFLTLMGNYPISPASTALR